MRLDWSEYFLYDESSPSCLKWAVSRWSGKCFGVEHVKPLQNAGCPDSKGQYQVNIDGRNTQAHRIIWEMFYGDIPEGFIIDHINGNGSDSRLINIRCIKKELNARNMKIYKNNSSGVCGIYLLTNKTAKGENKYWSAKWETLFGKSKNKRFSITRHGNDEAFRLACEYRTKMIEELNAQGAGYTEDHGKRVAA